MDNNAVSVVRKVRKYFKEYCNCTSIHGFRYFGERRTIFERAWWFIVFMICLSGCAYVISLVYMKWESSPIIVSFSTKETPIYKIPFPAVTICPETKTNKSLYSYSDLLIKLTENETLSLKEYQAASYMNLVCETNMSEVLQMEYERSEHNLSFDNYSFSETEFFDFLYEATPDPPIPFGECRWMNKEIDCEDLFQIVMTDEGICYTFNMLKHMDIYSDKVLPPTTPSFGTTPDIPENVNWNLDGGYEENDGLHTYPRRALFSGIKNALDLTLVQLDVNIDHACKISNQGFKVSLHTPMRVPRPSQQYYRLPLNEVIITAVQPVMITTSETVKVFKPQKRECYFQNEKPLQYFRRYSQQNCNLECLTNFTLYWCECVSFFMPRENGTVICGALYKDCTEEADIILQQGRLTKLLGKKRTNKRKNSTDLYLEEIPDCDCLPLCTDLSYNVETSSSRWDWKNIAKVFNDSIIEQNISLSRLIIYFKNSQFVTSKRHELYGPTDFLGNFGGLLGLFTGFSMLSLMEIIYFLTVRIFCNVSLYGNWSGNEN